ncbi:TlpA family protein disulfide reductase [Dokdonia ponticola]|uniref:TlpA family protein disulfide reductase n=1 Tax=Dokdonia ponticola TaxID=2041041 RepID=A0ABV9I1Y7_9FLAO
MKNSIWMLLALIFIGCTTDTSTTEAAKETNNTVIIKGKIDNYSPEKWTKEGVYVLPNYITGKRPEYNFPIDSLGNYTLEFTVDYPTDIFLYNGKSMSLIVHPGDRFTTQFDASIPDEKDHLTATKIEGTHAQVNQQFLEYQSQVLPEYQIFQKNISEKSTETFRAYLDSINTAKDHLIDTYIVDSETKPALKNWLKAEKIVSSKSRILSYEGLYRMYTQKNPVLPSNYYDVIEPINTITEEMLINTHLSYDFGRDYTSFIRQETNKKYPDASNSWKDFYPYFTKEILNRNRNNRLFAQLMINNWTHTTLEQQQLEYYESIQPILDSLYGESIMGIALKSRYTNVKNMLDNPVLPEDTELLTFQSESPEAYLDEIIANAQGKVIYIDNWATWCGPCKHEFKNSTPQLKEKFQKDVEFIYLCHQSEEKLWKPSIAEYKVTGKHYFLSQEESKPIFKQINLQGFPTYTIINKKGEIVTSGFEYRPSEAITSEILTGLIAE